MFECDGINLLTQTVKGCPVLVSDGGSKVPIVGAVCRSVDIDPIAYNQTLSFHLLVNHPPVLSPIHQDITELARLDLKQRYAPHGAFCGFVLSLCICAEEAE